MPKPLIQSSLNLVSVIRSSAAADRPHCVAIGSGSVVYDPKIREFAVPYNVTSCFVFLGYFNNSTVHNTEQILRKIYQKTSFLVRKCLMGVPISIFNNYVDTNISEKPQFWRTIDWIFLRPKTALTWE